MPSACGSRSASRAKLSTGCAASPLLLERFGALGRKFRSGNLPWKNQLFVQGAGPSAESLTGSVGRFAEDCEPPVCGLLPLVVVVAAGAAPHHLVIMVWIHALLFGTDA